MAGLITGRAGLAPKNLEKQVTVRTPALHRTSFPRNHFGGHESLQAVADLRRCHHPRLQWAEHGRYGPAYICCGRRGLQADGQVASCWAGLPLSLPAPRPCVCWVLTVEGKPLALILLKVTMRPEGVLGRADHLIA